MSLGGEGEERWCVHVKEEGGVCMLGLRILLPTSSLGARMESATRMKGREGYEMDGVR